MTTLEVAVLVLGTVTGVVTLVLVIGILRWMVHFTAAVNNKPTLCNYVVTYGGREEARCVLPIGHRTDHAVTLASVEACGYNQPPF